MDERTVVSAVQKLKVMGRTGWIRREIACPETIGAHSFAVALWCLLFSSRDIDVDRCIKMALLHDLAEAVTGDITPDDPGYETKDEEERHVLLDLFSDREDLVALMEEYFEQRSREAKFVRMMDKFDMILQAIDYGFFDEFWEDAGHEIRDRKLQEIIERYRGERDV